MRPTQINKLVPICVREEHGGEGGVVEVRSEGVTRVQLGVRLFGTVHCPNPTRVR